MCRFDIHAKVKILLLQAHKIGLFGQKIIWIFHGWYSSEFWRTNLEDIPCTEEDMEQAADGAFVIGYYPKNRIIERGVAGLTGESSHTVSYLA